MKKWEINKPRPSKLGDHDVVLLGNHLAGKSVALLVCGGIAAMKAPLLARELRKHGAKVKVYLTAEARKYVTVDAMAWSANSEVVTELSPKAEHLNLEQAFDLYILAPATYNTINKVRRGIADNLVCTTMATALGRMEEGLADVFICPTMHGNMHNSILNESLHYLQDLGVKLIPPRDDYGKHNLPEVEVFVKQVIHMGAQGPLKNKRILVTGGPTPVAIDGIRRVTNKFTGSLGLEIAKELFLRGADVKYIIGPSGVPTPSYLKVQRIEDYDEYKRSVHSTLEANKYDYAIFSAAVADYRPDVTKPGKIASGKSEINLNLIPTEKVIDEVARKFSVNIVSFKYQENIEKDELLNIAREKLAKGHKIVVANRKEDFVVAGEQVAYIVRGSEQPKLVSGKSQISRALADELEIQMSRGKINVKNYSLPPPDVPIMP